MRNHKFLTRLILSAVIIVSVLALAACPPHKSIAEILQDPARYQTKEISVHGAVVDSFGALGTGAFQIDDGTGRLWVLSSGYGVPAKGTRIAVAGTIQPTLSVAGSSFATIMRETQRRKY